MVDHLLHEYNFLFLFAIKSDDKDDKYIAKFKTLLRQNMKSIGNRWKYYFINSREEKTIKDIVAKYPKNIIESIGFNLLKDKASLSDLEDLKNFLLGKIDELALGCMKKFADKNETTNNFKYLEDQIKKILDMLSKKESMNEADIGY